jgi:argininosuccinate lyase
MTNQAIEELKKDWEAHSKHAAQGDARSVYAAREVFERLEQIGADAKWLECARSRMPTSERGVGASLRGMGSSGEVAA